ncbi:helicase associated domain-containing protein [Paeniglutamicibacter antarcticus]|uniref:Helicase associated domain-containing protein n=1 Tax=Arthrobacter terrae TaxID=2935737 RepID=A0A931CSJ6_9MICC|nr:helicase associated domain-containing protein [Arthrobacter terrae]MBG0741825.1 helicase associated domain-containing protein [Arthrobacter terrae]
MTEERTADAGESPLGSRHPEWDLMYRKGLPFGRIAELCHAPKSTVHRHLQVHGRTDPGLRQDHEANRPPLTGPHRRPTDAWTQRFNQLQLFMVTHQRPPATTGQQDTEPSLARWLSQQRSAARHGRLGHAAEEALDSLGNWRTPQRTLHDGQRWIHRLTELRSFIDQERRWPRYKGPRTEEERILGVWLHGQKQKHTRNTLTPAQIWFLDERVPGWSGLLRGQVPLPL